MAICTGKNLINDGTELVVDPLAVRACVRAYVHVVESTACAVIMVKEAEKVPTTTKKTAH